jgi:hypothetical protein
MAKYLLHRIQILMSRRLPNLSYYIQYTPRYRCVVFANRQIAKKNFFETGPASYFGGRYFFLPWLHMHIHVANHQPSSPCPWTAGFRPRNLLTKLRRRLLHYLPGERLMQSHSSIAECRWGVLNTTRLK